MLKLENLKILVGTLLRENFFQLTVNSNSINVLKLCMSHLISISLFIFGPFLAVWCRDSFVHLDYSTQSLDTYWDIIKQKGCF